MPQPASLFLARELNRTMPFTSQHTFRNAALAAAGTLIAAFDIGLATTDQNQLIGGRSGAAPSADPTQFAIGTLLDALAFSTGAGTILVEYAVDSTCSYRGPIGALVAVPAGTPANISGLRITGRFVRVTYTNTSGAGQLVEFGVYVRSA